MVSPLISWLIPALVPAVVAVAVKWHFATASVAELRWLMAPAAALTTLATGVGFTFESGVGYVSTAARYAIIPACSGLNFLVVAFGALSWTLASRARGNGLRMLGTWVGSAVLALGLTYAANATRLSLCVAMHLRGAHLPLLSAEESHRLVGMFVYLSALFAACHVAYHFAAQVPGNRRRSPDAALALGSAALWYLGFTLGLPLLNGAGRRPDFGAHAVWVLAVTLGLLGVALFPSLSRRKRLLVGHEQAGWTRAPFAQSRRREARFNSGS
jgi:exosortase K